MPLYEYFCLDCNKIYEIIVPLAEIEKEIECPHCDKALKKRISPPRTIKIN